MLQELLELTLGWLGSTLTLNLSGAQLLSGESLSVWVQSQENLLVLEWVLLQNVGTLLSWLTSWSNNSLDFRRVDDSGNIRVGQDVGWQGVARLGGGNSLGTPDGVQLGESRLGPDDESTNVSTWGQLQQTKGGDVSSLDTWDVSEGLDQTVVLTVDNQWTTSLDVTSASELTLTSSELLGLDDLDNVGVSTNSLQDSNSLLGLGDLLNVRGDNQWDLWNLLNSVTSGQNERSNSRSSNSRGSSVSLLVLVHLNVPFSPGLGWSKHTTTTTHVTESSLTSTVSTGTTDTWNTGNSTTSTPGLSRGLVTSVLSNSVSLTLVLVHGSEDRENNVWSDWSREDCWQWQSSGGDLTGGGENRDLWTGHFWINVLVDDDLENVEEEREEEEKVKNFPSVCVCVGFS